MLKSYNHDVSKAVYNIYTSDETLIYTYGPKSKQQLILWVFQNESKLTKVVRARSTLNKWPPVFWAKCECGYNASSEFQKGQFWMIHNHLFARTLRRSKKKQAVTHNQSSPWQSDHPQIGPNNSIFDQSKH